MSSASNYLETILLDYIFNGVDPGLPPVFWITIFTEVATEGDLEAGDLTNEVSTTRQSAIFDLAIQNQVLNSQLIAFPPAPSGGWGNVKYIGLMDAKTGGNIIIHGLLGDIKLVEQDDSFRLPAGSVAVTLN